MLVQALRWSNIRIELLSNYLTLQKKASSGLTAELRVINLELTNYCNQQCPYV